MVYAMFLGVFLYLIAFVENVFVPKTMDSGTAGSSAAALAVNLGLIFLFGLQHSVMARPKFKEWWIQYVPKPLERSTFVLVTNIIFILMFWFWRPMPEKIWDIESSAGRMIFWALSGAGWAIALISTFLINHFDLFGLRQAYFYWAGKRYEPVKFKISGFYRHVRNPLMLGFVIAFWAAPTMTVGHFVFAAAMTAYILIGIYFEERTIAAHLGKVYLDYKAQTPMLMPFRGKPAAMHQH